MQLEQLYAGGRTWQERKGENIFTTYILAFRDNDRSSLGHDDPLVSGLLGHLAQRGYNDAIYVPLPDFIPAHCRPQYVNGIPATGAIKAFPDIPDPSLMFQVDGDLRSMTHAVNIMFNNWNGNRTYSILMCAPYMCPSLMHRHASSYLDNLGSMIVGKC